MANQEKSAAELYRQERKERLAKAAKKNSTKSHNVVLTKKSKTAIAIVLVVALVAGIVGFSISNSGMLERGKVAFKVGDTEVTMAEYSYYYNSAFSNYFNYSYQYDYYYGEGMGAMYTGYDYSVSPDQQKYSGEIEGVEEPMFTDFFDHSAKESIKLVKASLAYAAEKGIELDENDLADVDKTIETVTENAKSSNYSLPAYLRAFYGKAMTKALLRQICEEQALVTKVQNVLLEEYADSYSEKEIEKTYEDEILTYGEVSLRNYVINAEKVTTEAESEDAEATEEVTKETLADAKKKADSFVAKLAAGEDFKTLAAEFEKLAGSEDYEEMKTDDSVTLIEDATYSDLSYETSDEDFLEWAMSKKTEKGATFVVEDETTGYTVYMMEAPVHKSADEITYDVRHILLQFAEEEETEETEEAEESEEKEDTSAIDVELLDASKYDVTVDIDVDIDNTKDKALYKEAQDILVKYLEGDKTEESFGELAAEHSADSNAADGGIYEDVAMGDMVPEFEGWSVAEDRKPGDVGIVETTYGYHIMYSVGKESTSWSDAIRNDLAAAEYEKFADELINDEKWAVTEAVEENVQAVEDFVVSLAKQQIRNIKANASAGTATY